MTPAGRQGRCGSGGGGEEVDKNKTNREALKIMKQIITASKHVANTTCQEIDKDPEAS